MYFVFEMKLFRGDGTTVFFQTDDMLIHFLNVIQVL